LPGTIAIHSEDECCRSADQHLPGPRGLKTQQTQHQAKLNHWRETAAPRLTTTGCRRTSGTHFSESKNVVLDPSAQASLIVTPYNDAVEGWDAYHHSQLDAGIPPAWRGVPVELESVMAAAYKGRRQKRGCFRIETETPQHLTRVTTEYGLSSRGFVLRKIEFARELLRFSKSSQWRASNGGRPPSDATHPLSVTSAAVRSKSPSPADNKIVDQQSLGVAPVLKKSIAVSGSPPKRIP